MRYVSAIIGFALIGLVLMFIVTPIETVKRVGAPLLVAPSAIGLYHTPATEEIQTIVMHQGLPRINVSAAGPYVLYTDEQAMLQRANMFDDVQRSWLTLRSLSDQHEINGMNITRGAMPYDSVAVSGRPIVRFEIDQPGTYEMVYARQSGTVYFLPDPTQAQEGRVVWAMLGQLVLVAIIIGLIFLPRIRQRMAQQREFDARLAEKRAQSEEFWKKR